MSARHFVGGGVGRRAAGVLELCGDEGAVGGTVDNRVVTLRSAFRLASCMICGGLAVTCRVACC